MQVLTPPQPTPRHNRAQTAAHLRTSSAQTLCALAVLVTVAWASTACTTQDGYRTAQGWQRQQCQKLQDRDERLRCEKQTELSYEKYRSQSESAKASP